VRNRKRRGRGDEVGGRIRRFELSDELKSWQGRVVPGVHPFITRSGETSSNPQRRCCSDGTETLYQSLAVAGESLTEEGERLRDCPQEAYSPSPLEILWSLGIV